MAALYYDDNFGAWSDMDDPDMQEFYRQVQHESVYKKCASCGKRKKLRIQYAICNSCAERAERGWDN